MQNQIYNREKLEELASPAKYLVECENFSTFDAKLLSDWWAIVTVCNNLDEATITWSSRESCLKLHDKYLTMLDIDNLGEVLVTRKEHLKSFANLTNVEHLKHAIDDALVFDHFISNFDNQYKEYILGGK